MVSAKDELMIIEDDRESRTFLTQLFQLEGFRVVAFPDGADALDYLAQLPPPCLIIMDIRMPVMDGLQFRAAMLRDPRLAEIPAVVVTAFEPPAAASLSALRVFRKPVDVDALLAVVRENC